MITEEEKRNIREVLESFLQCNNEWEDYCNLVDKDPNLTSEQKFQKQKERLVAIFDKYCTKKDRSLGRPTSFSYPMRQIGEPFPIEKIIYIEEKSKNGSIVYTEYDDSLSSKYQYLLKKTKEKWLLDSKKKYSNWKQKWVIVSL